MTLEETYFPHSRLHETVGSVGFLNDWPCTRHFSAVMCVSVEWFMGLSFFFIPGHQLDIDRTLIVSPGDLLTAR